MHRLRAMVVSLACLLALTGGARAKDTLSLMHLYEPKDAGWVHPVAQPKIPPPPKGKGLTDRRKLRTAPLLAFDGNDALAAEAAKPKGWVKGKGTVKEPYVIRDLVMRDLTRAHGISLSNITAPLIIENVLITGKPVDERTPAEANAIWLDQCESTVIRHCEVAYCAGIVGNNSTRLLFEDNLVYSCDVSIYTTRGSDCIARGNYVRDAQRYGVFLYHGPRHIIENNYVAWTQREGIGTNGDGQEAIYRNNIILHSGWTAINVEGTANDSLVEGNLVVDTYYGIILEGSRTICRKNKVYNSAQAGIILLALGDKDSEVIEDNFISCSGATGIDLLGSTRGTLRGVQIRNNRIEQSGTAIRVDGKDCVVEGNDIFRFFTAVDLTSKATHCRVAENRIYRGRNGVMMSTPSDVVVTNNQLSYLLGGIHTGASKHGTVEANTLYEVGSGIRLNGAEGWTIRKNVLDRVPYNGIELQNSRNVLVTDNIVGSGPYVAISLQGGSQNTVTGNTLTLFRGLWSGAAIILSKTKDNTITGNTLRQNAVAVTFKGPESTGNVFKDNVYQDNTKQIVMQEGAKEVDTTNTVDQPPVAR